MHLICFFLYVVLNEMNKYFSKAFALSLKIVKYHFNKYYKEMPVYYENLMPFIWSLINNYQMRGKYAHALLPAFWPLSLIIHVIHRHMIVSINTQTVYSYFVSTYTMNDEEILKPSSCTKKLTFTN